MASGRRRSPGRKAEIAAAAASLFCDRGYHRVGIDDVAREVGITGGAIYRHFANKGELLARTVDDGLATLEAALDEVEHDGVEGTLGCLATAAVDQPGFGVLLQREARNLDASGRARVRARVATITDRVATTFGADRPELAGGDTSFLARSALSALASPSYHRLAVSRARAEALLQTMTIAVARSATVPDDVAPRRAERQRPPRPARASRRETLLSAAIELFGTSGYQAVRMEDIGAAAGIAGPSIYEHFAGKADLLLAALTRGAEWLQLGMSQALAGSETSAEALEQVLASYVGFVLDNTELMSVLLTESIYLPEAELHSLRRLQHDYVDEWVSLLADGRPDLGAVEARFLVHGVLGIVNDTARNRQLRRRDGIDVILGGLGLEVLGVDALTRIAP